MDVKAIAQAAQNQQSVPAQDSGNGTAADMFAYLVKHSFGSNVGNKHTLINTQAAIDMVGTVQSAAPAALLNTPAAAPAQQSNTQGQSQANNTGNANNQQATGPAVNAANNNNNRNSGNGPQSNNTSSQNQQGSSGTNGSNGPAAQGNGPAAAAAPAPTKTGEDQATEETAAVMAAAVYIVQQQTAPVAAVDPVAAATTSGPATSGPQQQSAGPVASPIATQTAQQLAAAAEDEVAPEDTHVWTANFLSSGSTTPQMAQQAANLAKVTGPSGANITVQTTSDDSVAPTSTSTLVPNAVLAVPSFFGNGQGGTSTGDGSGQQTGQQTNDNAPQAVVDPAAQALAQDLQALSAISALLQGAAQNAIGTQQGASVAGVAAAAGATSATEAALPQPASAPTNPNGTPPSNFVAHLQETEEPEAPQAPKPIQLPSAIEQLKMQIEKGVAQGSTTIKVQLNPDNLGRVDVKLDVQNGQVKASISADHPETLALLKGDQAGLLQALQDAGLNADSNSLSFFLRGDQQRQFAQSGRQGRGQSGGADNDPIIAGIAATSGAAAASAANSALDISV